ncbi:MAG: phosphatase PAP2 family protein [Myxococcales bacterium]|nr:phosphatase PAP2 family protein [Myxococcales bacterium]
MQHSEGSVGLGQTDALHPRGGQDGQLEGPRAPSSGPRVLLRNLAGQDWVVLGLHLYLNVRMFALPSSPEVSTARAYTFGLLSAVLFVLLLTRGQMMGAGPLRSAIYRFGLFIPTVSTYFAMRHVMRALDPVLLDAPLLAIDRALFGETPSLLMEPLVTPLSVEFFAFFYYGYYALLGTHLFGTLLFDDGRRAYELLFGAAWVVAVGHCVYTLVPGVGPYAHCADLFTKPLEGGFWWRQVLDAVTAAGAALDIFPSLHTAYPSFLALHSLRYRKTSPYRYSVIPVCIIATVIVISTMFLRWHYAIDVVAGLLVAYSAGSVASWAYDRFDSDEARAQQRARQPAGAAERQPAWEPLMPAGMSRPDYVWLIGVLSVHLLVIVLASVLGARAH